MKSFLLASFFVLSTIVQVSAFADALPSWTRLPTKGINCSLDSAFQNGAFTCGMHRHEVWTCLTLSETGPSQSTQYLLSGDIVSDVSSTCSPVYVVKQVSKILPK